MAHGSRLVAHGSWLMAEGLAWPWGPGARAPPGPGAGPALVMAPERFGISEVNFDPLAALRAAKRLQTPPSQDMPPFHSRSARQWAGCGYMGAPLQLCEWARE